MKKWVLPLVASLGFISGCASQPNRSGPDVWHVDFQYAFDHERVIVSSDGVQAFAGSVTTNDSTGLAKSIAIRNRGDFLHLRIEVPATGVTLEKTLDPQQGLFLAIKKQFDGELSLEQQAAHFSY